MALRQRGMFLSDEVPNTRNVTNVRDVPDTTLPDTGFNWIVIYRILDSSKFKHKSYWMKWEYGTIVSVVYNWNLNKTCMCFHWFKWNWNKFGSLQMKAWLVKPVKHHLSSHSMCLYTSFTNLKTQNIIL